MGDWHYVLPAVSGLDFWDDSSGGTPLTSVDANGDLVNDPFLSNGQYTRTVYASVDPDGPLRQTLTTAPPLQRRWRRRPRPIQRQRLALLRSPAERREPSALQRQCSTAFIRS